MRIALDAQEMQHRPLQVGLSMEASIDTSAPVVKEAIAEHASHSADASGVKAVNDE